MCYKCMDHDYYGYLEEESVEEYLETRNGER